VPIVLLIIGAIFLAAAIRGKQPELFAVMKDDFSGPNNFWFWGLALFVIGAVGYYKPFKPLSNAFMLLVILVLFLKHGNPGESSGGFFQMFMSELRSGSSGSGGNAETPVDYFSQQANAALGQILN